MWYIFPQLKHLGHSYNSKYYGISGKEEAAAYLQHPVLNARMRAVCEAILELPINNAEIIFGGIDCRKLCSSMTLFDIVSPNDVFDSVLNKFYDGNRDKRTLSIVGD